jgi:hypothetical protein
MGALSISLLPSSPLLPYSLTPLFPNLPTAYLTHSPLLPYSLTPLFPFHSVGAYYTRVGVVAEAVAGDCEDGFY